MYFSCEDIKYSDKFDEAITSQSAIEKSQFKNWVLKWEFANFNCNLLLLLLFLPVFLYW